MPIVSASTVKTSSPRPGCRTCSSRRTRWNATTTLLFKYIIWICLSDTEINICRHFSLKIAMYGLWPFRLPEVQLHSARAVSVLPPLACRPATPVPLQRRCQQLRRLPCSSVSAGIRQLGHSEAHAARAAQAAQAPRLGTTTGHVHR